MTDHVITIERADSRSKFGRPKRQFHAVCCCGWADDWWPVQQSSAIEHGNQQVAAGR